MSKDIVRPHRDPLARLSIGEVAQQAGRRASSIRYYESIGLLPAPECIAGQRSYAPDVLRLLAVIDAGQRVGLTLEEIRSLLFAGRTGSPIGDTLRGLAERKLPEVEALIEHTQTVRHWLRAAGSCRCLTVDECALLNTDASSDCP